MAPSVIPQIDNFELTNMVQKVLQNLFPDADVILIEKEFTKGRTVARVFQIGLIKSGAGNNLNTVAKLGPGSLIRKEWDAYNEHIKGKLPFISRLENKYFFEDKDQNEWGGLSFELVGDGVLAFDDFLEYCQREDKTTKQILETLNECFFPALEKLHLLRCNQQISMQASYGSILPVDLMVEPTESSPANARKLTPDFPVHGLNKGDCVSFQGYHVTEIAEISLSQNNGASPQYAITVEPPDRSLMKPTHRIRIKPVADISSYTINQEIPLVCGMITQTQKDILIAEASNAFDSTVEFDAMSKKIPFDESTRLPNPFLGTHFDRILSTFRVDDPAWIGKIIGDLNIHNILVFPSTGMLMFIDFASAREDHILHDFVRVERGIITELVSDLISKPTLLHQFYLNLDEVCTHNRESNEDDWIEPALGKPFRIIEALRKGAKEYLADRSTYIEYYECLFLHLLGSLKFNDLNVANDLNNGKASAPKKLAVIGAASLLTLISDAEEKIPEELLEILPTVLEDQHMFMEFAKQDIPPEDEDLPRRGRGVLIIPTKPGKRTIKIWGSKRDRKSAYLTIKPEQLCIEYAGEKKTFHYDDGFAEWIDDRHVWQIRPIDMFQEILIEGTVALFDKGTVASLWWIKHFILLSGEERDVDCYLLMVAH